MAFQNKNMSVIACANGFTLWQYKTEDSIKDLKGNYFKVVADLMAVGDMFIINASDGNYIRFIKSIKERKVELCEL